jgi:hypothetical protein
MADQQPLQPPHNPHADEEEQTQTDVDRQTDVVPLVPSVVVGGAPRHCDDRPAASRAREEDEIAGESTQTSRRRPELYRDAIHAVYGWLTFNELATTCRISRSWYAAACNLKSRCERLKTFSDRVIYHLVRSPLRRHITQFTSDTDEYTRLTVASLLLLKTLMPHVDSLSCAIIVTEDTPPQLALPSGLRDLTIGFQFEADSPNRRALITNLMTSIARECPYLTRGEFGVQLTSAPCVWSTMDGRIVEPLSRISSLTALALYGRPHPTCIDVLRRMTQLRRIDLRGFWSDEALGQLTSGSHPQLALEAIGMVRQIDPTTAAALVRLPSLTQLMPIGLWSTPDPGTLLAHLPRLTKLNFECDATVDITLAIAALTRLTNLTFLTITHGALTSTHLATLLPHLTRLSELELEWCPALTSLACLSQTHHLASTLQKLWVLRCRSIPPFELHHLRALTSLQLLSLSSSLTSALDGLTIAGFTPGSPAFHSHHFPHLTKFVYHAPPPAA